jgi:hypothetical protein
MVSSWLLLKTCPLDIKPPSTNQLTNWQYTLENGILENRSIIVVRLLIIVEIKTGQVPHFDNLLLLKNSNQIEDI